MRSLAEKIFEIIKDYHCDHEECKHPMSVEHILNWANQFGDSAEFVLEEFLHIIPETDQSEYLGRLKFYP
ncbi:hypothetical protein GYM62_17790 [Algoriphagus sp. NBT04N3]|uniref:hypothetical protein n=1 Tax=Algoriphagus sp. NBT04N3 TaxID=2705473 RepID=UPI001C637556|nr:hypothetical protein [Algoriphagus sp. NBT04N3]QYH40559.1 hypothetical protein GYM62_17790 [Algoriphagus sp. NBT04N3]